MVMMVIVVVRLLLKTSIKFSVFNSVQDDGDENVFNENNEGDRRLAILMKMTMVVTLMMTPTVVLAS